MNDVCAIVLAAGEGTRMKSNQPKALSTVLFKPMIQWVIDALKSAGVNNICVVTGFKNEMVEEFLNKVYSNLTIAVQEERKGTAHAVISSRNFLLNNIDSDVVILGGDSPFIDSDTIRKGYLAHKKEKNSATVISASINNPFGYGRIVRDKESKKLIQIIEQKDLSEKTNGINEVNSGAYWFKVSDLNTILDNIKNENSQNEYYLPDAIKLMSGKGLSVSSFIAKNEKLILGANDRQQLSQLNEIARQEILQGLMRAGVDIPFKDGVVIGPDVHIEKDTRILPGTIINGKTQIGSNCVIGPNSFVTDCEIGNNIILNSVHLYESKILDNESIRPFTVIFNKNKKRGD